MNVMKKKVIPKTTILNRGQKSIFTWMIIGAYFRVNFVLKFSWWIWVTKTGTKTAFFGLSPVTSIFVTAISTATATGSALFRVQGWAWKIRLKEKFRFYVPLKSQFYMQYEILQVCYFWGCFYIFSLAKQ